MKRSICLVASLLALTFTPVFGQGTHTIDNATGKEVVQHKPKLTKFNLNFPGGTPGELVKAIEKATGKPLNVIIPAQSADLPLPPFKMNNVSVFQLLEGLSAASPTSKLVNGKASYIHYQFATQGELHDNSIWYLQTDQKAPLPDICRFYSLAPYLDRGFTVDDITTAIQTGWKMAGITSPPKLEYHKETKLLIADGEPDQLKTIDSVLGTLPASAITRNEVNQMKAEINRIESALNQLSKKVSKKLDGAKLPSSSEEKSGK